MESTLATGATTSYRRQVMNDMDTNPHYRILVTYRNRGNQLSPTVEATLALAFEQRTANLIALAAINPEWYGSTSPGEFEIILDRIRDEATK